MVGEFRKPETPRKIACIALHKNKSMNVMVVQLDTGCATARALGHLVHR